MGSEKRKTLFFSVIGSLGVLLPVSPANMPSTIRDSGVFLYIGWRMLSREMPYVQIWDHKPPLIYIINSLGLLLSDGSRWGVWFIELLLLVLTVFIGFSFGKKLFGSFPAFVASSLWLLTLFFLLKGGNLSTEYALPLQFSLFALLNKLTESDNDIWVWFWIGFLSALLFLLKQNTIGISLSIIFYQLLNDYKSFFLKYFKFLLGGAGIVFVVLFIWLGLNHSIYAFLEQAFLYNFIYSTDDLHDFSQRLMPVLRGIDELSITGLFQFGLGGYLWAFRGFITPKKYYVAERRILFVSLLNLPLELIFVSISGKTYPHYFITLLPVFFVFSAFFVKEIMSIFFSFFFKYQYQLHKTIFMLIVLILFSRVFDNYLETIKFYQQVNNDSVNSFIQDITEPNDYVLIWGADAKINFSTRRVAPTRFVYLFPLYEKNFSNEKLIEEFLDDVIAKKTKIIVDTHDPKMPFLNFPIYTDKIEERLNYLRNHYIVIENIEGWTIYEYHHDLGETR